MEDISGEKEEDVEPSQTIENKTNRPAEGSSDEAIKENSCLLYTSPSPRDRQKSRMPSSA